MFPNLWELWWFLDKFPSLPSWLTPSLPHSHSHPASLPPWFTTSQTHSLTPTPTPQLTSAQFEKVLTFQVTGNRPITMATTLLQASTEYGRCRGHSAGHSQCFPFVIDLLANEATTNEILLSKAVWLPWLQTSGETVVKQLVQWSVTTTRAHIHNLYQWLNKWYQSPYHLTNDVITNFVFPSCSSYDENISVSLMMALGDHHRWWGGWDQRSIVVRWSGPLP